MNRYGAYVLISGGIGLIGCMLLWSGSATQVANGRETTASIVQIVAGIWVAVLGLLFALFYLRILVLASRLAAGKGAIARWTVPPDALDAFRDAEANRSPDRYDRNTVRLPRRLPPNGIEVIFGQDAVLIGGRYRGLQLTGMHRFTSFEILAERPLCVAFSLRTLTVTNRSAIRFRDMATALRIPVAPGSDEALRKVVAHFRGVMDGTINPQANYWRRRIRISLVLIPVFLALAVAGYVLERSGILRHKGAAEFLPLVMVIAGVVFGAGALVFGCLCWRFHASHPKTNPRSQKF